VQVTGWFIGALLLLLSAFGSATAIGLLHRQKWARVSAIAWAIAMTSPGLNLTAPKPGPVALATDFAMISVAFWALFVLVRPKADAEFFEPGRESRLPAAVSAVGWLLVLSSLDVPACLVLHLPFFIFGRGLFGWPAGLAHALTSLLLFVAGVALLRMKSFGMGFALGLLILEICNGIVNDLSATVQTQLNHVISDILAKFNMSYASTATPLSWEILASSLTNLVMAACLVGFWTKYQASVTARLPLTAIEGS